MKKTLLKSLMCFMLALSIIAGTVATAFADELIKNCYTADNAELLDEYINAYGWDKDKMLAKNWTDNGKEYKRQIGGQREYLADCFKGTDDFLMSEPEFDKDNKIILEGNKEKNDSVFGKTQHSPRQYKQRHNGLRFGWTGNCRGRTWRSRPNRFRRAASQVEPRQIQQMVLRKR